MKVPGIAPTLTHAELHEHYLPWPDDPHLAEAKRVAESINQTKVQDPATGAKIYDSLVDSLVENTLALAKQHQHAPEPITWTAPQRAVWRFSKLPYEQRATVVEDRSVHPDFKTFASINAGRWLVQCPFVGCHGAQYASFGDRRFFCTDCSNKAVGGKWIEVVWPKDHLAVEAWLDSRPVDARHWNPGEDGSDIAAQDAYALGHGGKPVVKSQVSFDPNTWPKQTTLSDGSVVPVLHCGTKEWDESQKVEQ